MADVDEAFALPMPSAVPEWVRAMHAHYHRTGFYRTQDLQRVLGDPRKHFEGYASDELVAACALARAAT